MIRKVFWDYLDQFRWGNMKKKNLTFVMIWFFIYLLLYVPGIVVKKDGMGGYICYYAGMIPLMLVIVSNALVSLSLPKQLFLCPLQKRERRRYVHDLWLLKVTVPMIFGLTGAGIQLALNLISPAWIAVQLFALLSASLSCSLCMWRGGILRMGTKEIKKTKKHEDQSLRGLSGITTTGFIINTIVLLFCVQPNRGFLWEILALVLSAAELILDILMLRYLKPVTEVSIDYERKMLI